MRMTADRFFLKQKNSHKKSHGFTLIEIIVSIVVFGILMALLTAVFAPNVVRGTDPLFSIRAAELGQSYLDEILGKRFAENSLPGNALRCGEAGGPGACTTPLGKDGAETRATFDDVDDYDGLNEPSATDSNGNLRSGYTGFRVAISVTNAGADIGVSANDAKRINVTITAPNGGVFVFSAYKANF